MNEERTSCTGNGFHTEITPTTQSLLTFISAFEIMGPFVPGALVENRVIRGLLRLKKRFLRESPTTRRLAHSVLPMTWVQISRLWFGSCKSKSPMHTTYRKYKDLGQTTLHPVCDLPGGFYGASIILPFLHMSCLPIRRASHVMATSTAETATYGTRTISTQCSSEFTRRNLPLSLIH